MILFIMAQECEGKIVGLRGINNGTVKTLKRKSIYVGWDVGLEGGAGGETREAGPPVAQRRREDLGKDHEDTVSGTSGLNEGDGEGTAGGNGYQGVPTEEEGSHIVRSAGNELELDVFDEEDPAATLREQFRRAEAMEIDQA
jgi:hypothetical protein